MKHKPPPAAANERLRSSIVFLCLASLLWLLSTATANAQVLVSVTATDGAAAESPVDDGEFTISTPVPPLETVTVAYTVTGTATSGDDYTALTGEVMLGPMESSVTIPVMVGGDDDVFEGEETVIVTLVDNGDIPILPGEATVTITDSNYAVTATSTANASEDPVGGGELTISLDAINRSGAALDVTYDIAGTATAGADYQALSGTASIPVGDSSASVSVTPLADDEPEDDETVEITLTTVSDARVSIGDPSTASLSIADGDEESDAEVILSVTASDDSAREAPPDAGEFLIRRVGGSDRTVTVSYSVAGSATPGDDYTQLAGSATLDEGEEEVGVTLQVTGNDASLEGDETVEITLLPIDGEISITDASATLTIVDSAHAVTATRVSNASENPLGIGRLRISLGASNDSGKALVVDYNVGGSATAGTDYSSLSGTASIPTGAGSVDIDVTPIDDPVEEMDETVAITLTTTNNPDVTVGNPSTADLLITDGGNGDGIEPVELSISAADATVGESAGGTGEFLVSRIGGSNRAVTVAYAVSGSASPGGDYTALPGIVSLNENQEEVSIGVQVPGDDGAFEGNETVVLRLLEVEDEISVPGDAATITIEDSNYEVFAINVSNATESPIGAGEISVSLGARNDSGSALSVNYSVAGSATPGTDYQALNGIAVIPNGSTFVNIMVTPLDDALLEDSETVEVTLTGTSDSRVPVGEPPTASVFIVDDDSGNDDDGDGVSNDDECPDSTQCRDTDGNGIPDYQDSDDDGDGIPTLRENAPQQDTDGNGTPDYLDDDDDGDGRSTAEEDANADGDGDPSTEPTDLDGDGVPDYLDADDTGGPAGDADGDGLTNQQEQELGTDPQSADTDNDGVNDGDEVADDTDPLDQNSFADADDDFVPDAVEETDGTDPTDAASFADSDNGGTADHIETVIYANNGIPASNVADAADDARDLDGDGLPDRLELIIDADPKSAESPTAGGAGDDDVDGIPNAVEAWLMTLGILDVDAASDLDRDGYPDAREVALGLNPLRADDVDADGDGVPNVIEALAGQDIDAATDTDRDGIPDAAELGLGFDLLDANVPAVNGSLDDDDDGISNAIEDLLRRLGGADDTAADTDSDEDGLPDANEIRFGTDPLRDDQPVSWIELQQQGIGPVKAVLSSDAPVVATAVVGGRQTGTLMYDWSDSDTAILAVSSGGQTGKTLTFTPQTLPTGSYELVLHIERTAGDYLWEESVVTFPLIVLVDDESSAVADADGDGIADADDDFDARSGFANEIPAQGDVWMQANTGVRLQLGSTARASRSSSTRVTLNDIANAGDGTGGGVGNSSDDFEYPGGIYDFEVTALPEVGDTVQIVIPLGSPIGEFAEYRKFRPASGWMDFAEDSNNRIDSAAGSSGGCPAPGDASYEPGLTPGHLCVQLTIEDGGPNDADADLGPNGIIRDPGGVATPRGEVSVGSGSGRTEPLAVAVLALLTLFVAAARRQGRSKPVEAPAIVSTRARTPQKDDTAATGRGGRPDVMEREARGRKALTLRSSGASRPVSD